MVERVPKLSDFEYLKWNMFLQTNNNEVTDNSKKLTQFNFQFFKY